MNGSTSIRGMRLRTKRSGSVLVMTLIIISALTIAGLAMFTIGMGAQKQVTSSVDDERAFALAEAGLHEAMVAVRAGGTGNVGRIGIPAYQGGGLFWAEATPLANDRTQVVVIAMAGSGRRAIEAVIDNGLPQQPLFQTTLNSKDTLTVNEDVVIDSYDSTAGSYASQAINTTLGVTHANMNGDVRSNLDIRMSARSKVFGDATPGPGHLVSSSTDSYVSGSTLPATEPFSFDPIVVPTFTSQGPFGVAASGSFTMPAGDYAFDSLSIGNSARLTVQGPARIVVGSFSGIKNGRLEIDATKGPVTIFCTGTYFHDKGFEAIPAAGSPMALAFMISQPQSLTFPSLTKVRGAYYAPDCDITFTSGCEAWGAFAGNRVSMSSAMRFHYDEALASYWSNSGGQANNTRVLAWTERSVEPAWLLRDRRDPFRVLRVQAIALPSPAQAWDI